VCIKKNGSFDCHCVPGYEKNDSHCTAVNGKCEYACSLLCGFFTLLIFINMNETQKEASRQITFIVINANKEKCMKWNT
jgi:hypothetical protein